jgi:gas vesicle protein
MANIKNFGIVGVGAGVQFGKGGAQLIQTAGTFAAKNATGNAFVRFQLADGASTNDAVSYQQLGNAVTLINSNVSTVALTLSNTITGAGLNGNGSYTAPTGTNYLNTATSLNNADFLLDAALAAEVTRAEGAESALSNALVANVATLQGDITSASTTLRGLLEGELAANVAVLNSNATSNYNNLISLIGTAQNDVGNLQIQLEAELAANVSTINGSITSNVTTLQGEINTNYNTLQSDITSATSTLQTTLEGELAANVVTLNNTIGGVQSTLNQSITANAVAVTAALQSELAANVATINGYISANAVAVTAALQSELASNVSTLTGYLTSNVVTLNNEINAVLSNIATIEGTYVNVNGSNPMTGTLNMNFNKIANVATGVSPDDAVNVAQLESAIAVLGNAFDYIGTVVPNAVEGSATVMPSGQPAGAYYKALATGYLIGAEANAVAFFVNLNDGVVRNTANTGQTWDVIAHVDSQSYGTAGQIDVTGTVDTGFTISIDAAYTAAAAQALSNEANARVAGDSTNANAIAAETTRAEAAELVLTNSVVLVNANVSALAGRVSSDEANASALAGTVSTNYTTLNAAVNAETVRALAAESALSNAIANATSSSTAAETARAEAAELALSNAISLVNSNVSTLSSTLSNAISTETARAEAAELVLTNSVVLVNANVSALAGRVSSDEANASALANTVALQGVEIANNTANIAALQASVGSEAGEIANIVAAAGLQTGTGNYVANTGANYIANAVSLFDADRKLDNAVASLSLELSTLSQDTIKTTDGLNSVHVGTDYVVTKLNVGGNATVVSNVVAGANTNSYLGVDLTNSDEVVLGAYGVDPNVDLRLVGQGSGHVIIGETGVGVIQADTGYDMTVAGGAGANLNLLGDTVNIGEADSTTIGQFSGTAGATGYLTFANGNTAVTVGAAGTGSNIDLVFAPKGTGVVNVSGTKIINVANATNSGDAVNYGQLSSAVSASLSGIVSTFTCTLPATTGSVSLGTVTGTVLSVKVLVSAVYDVGSTITVDDSATAGLAASSDIDESTVGIYMVETLKSYSAQPLVATVTNATGMNGAATVVVEYIHA